MGLIYKFHVLIFIIILELIYINQAIIPPAIIPSSSKIEDLLIFKEENTINELLDNIQKIFKNEEINKKITDDSFNAFWIFFVEKNRYSTKIFFAYITSLLDRY